jgi:hypothetical protein
MVDDIEEKSDDTLFTEAFETLAKTGEVPALIEAKEPESVVEAPVEGESDEGNTPEEPVGEGAAGDAPVAADGVPAEQAETPAPKEPQKAAPEQDLIDKLAQAVKDRVQPQQAQPEPAPQAYDPPETVLTQDDYKTLESFQKDWPDVDKAVGLMLKDVTHRLTNHIFKEFANEARPVFQEVYALRQWKHQQELQTKVGDYEDVRDKVVEWANSQPDYLRSAYSHVIQRGTPEQVADLIARYKAENAPPPAPAPIAAPQPPKQLSPAIKKAAEKLAPVQSKRSNVVRGDDPNDYEGAFENWAKMN